MEQLNHSVQSRNKMNKRGFLLGEFTLKVLVAIVCIVVLLFLLFKVYQNFTGQNELMQADASLNALGEEITSAVLNDEVRDYIILNPKGWVLVYFGVNDQRPNKCNGNCLCICEEKGFFGEQSSACDKKGMCKNVAYSVTGIDKSVKIDKPIGLSIKKDGNNVDIFVK